MSTITLYGIPNCDSVKKARRWLEQSNQPYQFHDVKKDGCETSLIAHWIDQHAETSLINKRSTTWKSLDDSQRTHIETALASASSDKRLNQLSNEAQKIITQVLANNPTLIKRPVLIKTQAKQSQLLIGFNEQAFTTFFQATP